jgi:hypothetical protein
MPNFKSLSIAALFVFLGACASPGLSFTVDEPAKNPSAAKLRSVAVMEFTGPFGHVFTSSMDAMLRSANYEGYPWFDVSPYRREAYGFSASRSDAISMGEDLGVEAVWFGEVYSSNDQSYPFLKEKRRCVEWDGLFDCERRETYTVECVDIEADVEVHAMLVEVATGRIVADRTLRDYDDDRVCREAYGRRHNSERPRHHTPYYDDHHFGNGWGSSERGRKMARRMVAGLSHKLRKEVAPFQRTAYARLMETPTTPYVELNSGFASALVEAKSGRNQSACRQFESMYDNYPDDGALIYNMGACAEMFGELDKAGKYYDTALQKVGMSASDEFRNIAGQALTRLGSLQASQAYLKAQTETN